MDVAGAQSGRSGKQSRRSGRQSGRVEADPGADIGNRNKVTGIQLQNIPGVKFTRFDPDGTGNIKCSQVPDLVQAFGRDAKTGKEVQRILSCAGGVESVPFEEFHQTLKQLEEDHIYIREELNGQIVQEEKDKAKIQKELTILTNRLKKIDESLVRKTQARNEYDVRLTIQDTEAAAASVPMVDGKQFLRMVRSQLSYEAFDEFLANIERHDNHQQTPEETLEEARRIFGRNLAHLNSDFEQLLDSAPQPVNNEYPVDINVEVWSSRTQGWLAGVVMESHPDKVRVKYKVGREICEKTLSKDSDKLRVSDSAAGADALHEFLHSKDFVDRSAKTTQTTLLERTCQGPPYDEMDYNSPTAGQLLFGRRSSEEKLYCDTMRKFQKQEQEGDKVFRFGRSLSQRTVSCDSLHYSDQEISVECPGGHKLSLFQTTHGRGACDGCMKPIPKGTSMYGCRTCDYDGCQRCIKTLEDLPVPWSYHSHRQEEMDYPAESPKWIRTDLDPSRKTTEFYPFEEQDPGVALPNLKRPWMKSTSVKNDLSHKRNGRRPERRPIHECEIPVVRYSDSEQD